MNATVEPDPLVDCAAFVPEPIMRRQNLPLARSLFRRLPLSPSWIIEISRFALSLAATSPLGFAQQYSSGAR